MTTLTVPENLHAGQPSRYFTVRFARFLGRRAVGVGRFVRSRRMVYTLAVLTVCVWGIHQYENWRVGRELAKARAAVLARFGTENLMDILPEVVPEEENFFAIPIIKSWWKNPTSTTAVSFEYVFPAEQLLPDGFQSPVVQRDNGDLHLDLPAREQQCIAAGRPLPAGESPASALANELASHSEITTQLIAGLQRPRTQIIPCRRASLLEAGGDSNKAKLPHTNGGIGFQHNLAIHLLAAATAGDAAKTRGIAGVMLTLAEGCVNDPNLVPLCLGMALSKEVLGALNEALSCSTLTDADFLQIQEWLAKTNDVEATERTNFETLLSSAAAMELVKTLFQNRAAFGPEFNFRYFLGTLILPVSWIDSNRAFASRLLLLQCGTGGAETWRSGDNAKIEVNAVLAKKMGEANPRELLGRIAIPGLSGLWLSSAKNLFKRRCAILTCALHRHRLLHGSYPASLTDLDTSLLPSPQPDPARADAPMNYKLTGKGFLLWSVGMDRVDDGGDAEKDWLWRHEAEKPVLN